ncbi:response regulator transcription factor [Cohnella zeiphila]|uniref:Response regulator n=1 Tax=Cohnella zeiphila TaxID=2761120 RepID=A0A7X0SS99_9BACL|nr:response regulator [Cohnella zeiphila]MBB6734174.1 response regulator [Cohnella zeiphila]
MIRVLIVDDEKLVRQGIISSLPWEAFGMQVVGEAKNGEKAVEFLEQNEADLMLTDLAMPVMSGIELMRIVRKRYPNLYIIVLTLHQDFEYIQEALRLGAIDYIAKVELVQDRFHEILQRIHARITEEESKRGPLTQGASAVEAESGPRMTPAADDAKPASAEGVDEETERWSALGWIYDDGQFEERLQRLKTYGLTGETLARVLADLAESWNEQYGLEAADRLNPPRTVDVWDEAESWLVDSRGALSRLLDGPQYSLDVRDAVKKAERFIQEDLSGQLHVADIAKRVNISRSYFSQCFKDITGKTFNEYVRQARVDKAKEYLVHTNRPILWIAEKTGYLDGKYFSSVFRDQTGLLPSAFRKAYRRENGK